jgi:hypothetical protein
VRWQAIGNPKEHCMKKIWIIALSFCFAGVSHAQLIAGWTFETNAAPGSPGAGVWITNIVNDLGSGIGFGSALHAGAASYTVPAGNGSTKSLSVNTWAVGDLFQFVVNTTGSTNIGVSFDQTSSTSGPGRFDLAYSTDGSIFTTFASSYIVQSNAAPNPVWNSTTSSSIYNYAFDLSSVPALNGISTAYFRLIDSATTTAGGGAASVTGTDRIDNFRLSVVPEPSSMVLASLGGLLGLFALRCKR